MLTNHHCQLFPCSGIVKISGFNFSGMYWERGWVDLDLTYLVLLSPFLSVSAHING